MMRRPKLESESRASACVETMAWRLRQGNKDYGARSHEGYYGAYRDVMVFMVRGYSVLCFRSPGRHGT